jgi:hypothetical protein
LKAEEEINMSNTLITQVVEHMKTLPDNLQKQVLEFVQTLEASVPRGVAGQELLRFAGLISPEDLQLMQQAIEDGCEQVDVNEW